MNIGFLDHYRIIQLICQLVFLFIVCPDASSPAGAIVVCVDVWIWKNIHVYYFPSCLEVNLSFSSFSFSMYVCLTSWMDSLAMMNLIMEMAFLSWSKPMMIIAITFLLFPFSIPQLFRQPERLDKFSLLPGGICPVEIIIFRWVGKSKLSYHLQ